MRILTVEDNFQVRRLLKSMLAGLAGLAAEFYECDDGTESLAACTCHQRRRADGHADGPRGRHHSHAADQGGGPRGPGHYRNDYDQPNLRQRRTRMAHAATW
jgi:CheY-like chemotaxis protein